LDFTGAKDNGGCGNNWSYKTCKAPVKLTPPINNYKLFTDWMPSLSPNQQCQSNKGEKSLSTKPIALYRPFLSLNQQCPISEGKKGI